MSSLPRLRDVIGLCLDVWLGAWGPDPVLYQLFAIQKRSFPIRKKTSRNGSGSHVPSKTPRYRLPTAFKLGSEDSQISGAYALQVWWRPVSARRGLAAAVKFYARKHVFSCVGSEQIGPITTDGNARGSQYDEGKTCFVFCFLERKLLA